MRMTLTEIKNKAKDIIPDGIPYTVDLEAGTISIITPTPDAFTEQSNSLTVKLFKAVRRKIVIRPDPSILSTEEEVLTTVREVVPEEAEITNIWLDLLLRKLLLNAKICSSNRPKRFEFS